MKIVVKYFYTICQSEQRKEIIRQMIAETFDESIEFDGAVFKDEKEFLEFIFPYRLKSLNKLGENKNKNYCNILISELIASQQNLEQLLAQQKRELSQTEILNIYKEIDQNSDGYIDAIKLQKYLSQSCSFNATIDDIIYLFRRMDRDQDGYISLAEFLNEFQSEPPQSQMSTMAQTRYQSVTSSQQSFTPPYSEDCKLFAQFINKLQLNHGESLIELKKQFIKQKQQSFLTLFEYIAHSIYLDKQDLQNLLNYFHIQITCDLRDICCIFNKEQPEQIEFKDFLNFFTF